MLSNHLVTYALVAGISFLVLASQVEASPGEEGSSSVGAGRGSRFSVIPSWTGYVRFFNKKYSSLSQQLLRQKLFIARAIEVYLTRIKYKLMQLSYYTAINEYSDATPDEARRLLSGDQSDIDLDKDPPMDDDEAERLLLETLNESQRVEGEEEGESTHLADSRRRRKRSSSTGEEELPPADGAAGVKIRWRVPSNNPDYEPLRVSEVKSPAEEKVAKDIPADRAAEIEIGTGQVGYGLSGLAQGGLGKMKSMIGGAMDWLSPNQQDSQYDSKQPAKSDGETDAEEDSNTTVIVDWRQSGCMGPVRNQGDCLSCYAVSAIGFMEWALCRDHDNQLTPLSVQYMVSCGPQYKEETRGKVRLDGCETGTSRHTVDFIREYGLELEANMPYLERDTECPLEAHTPRKKKGYFRPNAKPAIRLKSKTTQLDLALRAGPVIVGMWEPKNFLAYGGGVVEHCYQEGGHAMLIVGAIRERGEEYLIIKNSFGPGWGYDGYFKFKRSAALECVKEFIVPRVSFPGKKAQARRIKAYLADQQTLRNGSDESNEDEDTRLDTTLLN